MIQSMSISLIQVLAGLAFQLAHWDRLIEVVPLLIHIIIRSIPPSKIISLTFLLLCCIIFFSGVQRGDLSDFLSRLLSDQLHRVSNGSGRSLLIYRGAVALVFVVEVGFILLDLGRRSEVLESVGIVASSGVNCLAWGLEVLYI